MATPFRILLLAGAALAAGALFASGTSRSIAPYRHQPGASLPAGRPDAPTVDAVDGTEPSWLDRGFAVFGGPAWPFGREQWRGGDPEAEAREDWRDDPGYAPEPPGGNDGDPAYGQGGLDDPDGDERYAEWDSVDQGQSRRPDRMQARDADADGSDAAAKAAARARAAAQDVLAAEQDN